MEHMITTFAHGNGPYSRMVDLALAVNEEFEKRKWDKVPIVVPLVYGNKQKRIMQEDFGEVIRENPDLILLDEFYGGILSEMFYKAGHYQENLEFLIENQAKLEMKLRDYLSGTLKVETFVGEQKSVNGDDIEFEISHNPRVATGYENSFYTSIVHFSELLERTRQEEILDFDPSILEEVGKIAHKIEDDKNVHFIHEPFVFSGDDPRGRWKDEIYTPPLIHFPKLNSEKIDPGMYASVTGIEGLRQLFDRVNEFGMKVYCSPFIEKIEGADNRFGPELVSNENIKYQFGRTGWSTVWFSHLSETPLIAPAYTEGDDPEIYFNERTIGKLGLAAFFDGKKDPERVILEADDTRKNLQDVNRKLMERYKTLDGINYIANVIVDSLECKDISPYRNIEPALSAI